MRAMARMLPLSIIPFCVLFCGPVVQADPVTYEAPLEAGLHRNLQVDDVSFDLYVPRAKPESQTEGYRLLLVLPGWKYDKERWVNETRLRSLANEHSMILILPQMNISIYASRYFPETRMKWNKVPGLQFINERFIPQLNDRFGFFVPGRQNYLLGLSTGARGVALIALSNPDMFIAGSAISGDYDQSVMPADRLMASVYGPFEKFASRWRSVDNPVSQAASWKMPIYISHGEADKIVPASQTQRFYDAIKKKAGPNTDVQMRLIPAGGHDFRFWDAELEPTFIFFQRYFDER